MTTTVARRIILSSSAAVLLGLPARAQRLQSRYIRCLVGFGAGDGTDVLARLYAQRLQQVLGTAVVIENKPGASQVLAIRLMMAAPADGYTLMVGTGSSLAQGPGVIKGLPYDPLKDFSYIGMIATAAGIFFVQPDFSIRSMGDLINYAKANPGKLNYGSGGVGSASNLQMEYLKRATGVDIVHVPYKSGQEAIRAVMAGQVQIALTVAQTAIPLVAAGNIRALAVTGSERLPAIPSVPSLAETDIAELKGIDAYSFYGLIGPAGMSPVLIDKLNAGLNEVSLMPDVVKQMRDVLVFEPVRGSPASFKAYVRKEVEKWSKLASVINMPPWSG